MSSKLLSILALVALVCIIGLVTVQVLELMHYTAPVSVWPN